MTSSHTQSAGKNETGGKTVKRGKDSEGHGMDAKCRKISTSFPGYFSSFLEKVYWEPRDQPQPGSFGCFLEGGRDRTLWKPNWGN